MVYNCVSKQSLALVVGTCLIPIVTFAIFQLRTTSAPKPILMGTYLSGEKAVATITLTRAEMDSVYDVTRSCGCIRVRSGGEVPKLPIQIPRNGSRELDIELETLGIVGKFRGSVRLLGTLGGKKIEKRIELEVFAFPGWRVEPPTVQFDNCDEGEVFHSSLCIYRHKQADALVLEDVVVSDKSRMILNKVMAEPDAGGTDGEYQLYSTIRLDFTFTAARPTETIEIIGSKGKVKFVIPVVATLRSNALKIKPRTIFRRTKDNDESIVWIEHSSKQRPKLISEGSNYQVEFQDSVQKDQHRSVTKALIRPGNVQDGELSKTQTLVFDSLGSRAEVEIVLEDLL